MDNTQQKPLTPMHKYSIMEQKHSKGIKVLVKDGTPCKCHKVSPLLIPDKLSGFALQYENCSTNCSRALLLTDGENTFYYQNCEMDKQKFLLENAKVELLK
jgi:hypothetical protein